MVSFIGSLTMRLGWLHHLQLPLIVAADGVGDVDLPEVHSVSVLFPQAAWPYYPIHHWIPDTYIHYHTLLTHHLQSTYSLEQNSLAGPSRCQIKPQSIA